MRVVLVVSRHSYRVGAFLDAARALEFEAVVVSDHRPALATAGTVHIDDVDRMPGPVDGVVATDDWGVPLAARLAGKWGTPGHPPESVEATLDKRILRERLGRAGLRQPSTSGHGPWIVKPPHRSASEGVTLARTPVERDSAVVASRARYGVEPVVEEFVDGPEVIVEGLLVDGHLHVVASFDKPGERLGPTFPETMLIAPSSREPEAVAAAAQACAALGLRDGAVHVEVVVADVGPVVLEVHARSIGGRCSSVVAVTPALEELILLAAVGRFPGFIRHPGATGVYMLPVPRAGRLIHVDGVDDAAAVRGVTGVDITAVGRVVVPLPERGEYLGFVYAAAPTPSVVEHALRTAVEHLVPRFDP